jgi:hypothetical protein
VHNIMEVVERELNGFGRAIVYFARPVRILEVIYIRIFVRLYVLSIISYAGRAVILTYPHVK